LANKNFADLFKLAVTPFGHDQSIKHQETAVSLQPWWMTSSGWPDHQFSAQFSVSVARDGSRYSLWDKSQTIHACCVSCSVWYICLMCSGQVVSSA